jgi:hypothetical protein
MSEAVLSKNGVPIRLTYERWEHIVEQHSELSDQRANLLATIAAPERILLGNNNEHMAVKTIELGKWLVVIYRELEQDGFVITAFFTRRDRSLEKRVVLWSQSNNT